MPSSSSSNSANDFDSNFRVVADIVTKRPLLIVGPVLVIIVVAAVTVFMKSQRSQKSEVANNALFQAQQTLESEMKVFAASVAPPVTQGTKAPATPQKSPQDVDELLFRRTDVDSKFPQSLRKFEDVIEHYPGTRAAFEASLSVGGLYANHGQSAKALPWYEKAVGSAPTAFDKALALSSLGSAEEGAGKFPDAIQSYQKAIDQGEPGLKGDLLLSIARNYGLEGNKKQAAQTYDEVISELPDSEQAHSAALLKEQLQH